MHDDFEDRPQRYDAMIDWGKRLANETPFYRRLFEEHGVTRVLDAACGTGRHAEMFHGWGLAVEGADLSPAMIRHCRERVGESDGLRWVERSFDQPCDSPGQFDAVICAGNSLALAGGPDAVGRALRAMLEALRPGGVCVVQVLNLWRLPDGETVWQQCRRVTYNDEAHILIKSIHRISDRALIDFADLKPDAEGLDPHFHSTTFRGIEADELLDAARGAGASETRLYGNHQEAPYDRDRSQDIILICQR